MALTQSLLWKGLTRGWRGTPSGDEVVREVLRRIELDWCEVDPGKWRATVRPVHGYLVRFHAAAATDTLIFFEGGAGIAFRREWLPRELLIELLEANFNYKVGSNRLVEGPDGLTVVHGQVCDTRMHSVDMIVDIARVLLKQTEQLVYRLYAKQLVLPPRTDRDS